MSQCRGERLEARVAALERASASPLGPALDRNELAYLMDELEKKLEALDGLPLPEGARKELAAGKPVTLKIACRAVDGDFNSQPEFMHQCWNVLGVQVNHWCRTKLNIDPSLKQGETRPAPALPEPGYPKPPSQR